MIVLLGEFLQFHPQAFELCLPFPVFEELMHNDGQKQPGGGLLDLASRPFACTRRAPGPSRYRGLNSFVLVGWMLMRDMGGLPERRID